MKKIDHWDDRKLLCELVAAEIEIETMGGGQFTGGSSALEYAKQLRDEVLRRMSRD